MEFARTLYISLVVLLTACASPISLPSNSKPDEAWLVRCEPLKERPFENMGDAVEAVLDSIKEYDACAKRHNALVEFERKRK